jgi:hypothetical protein
MTNKERVQKAALEVLADHPKGINYSPLQTAVKLKLPDVPPNTIQGNTWNLEVKLPHLVSKPARGLYILKQFEGMTVEAPIIQQKSSGQMKKIREEDFYESFAAWLVKDIEECTRAVPLGGNRFKDKWGTPDVVGIRMPKKSDIIQSATEITSAEIKIDTAGLITAFGQACAYKIFSHRSYIVVPKSASEEDLARLDSLCLIFGVGLILYDSASPSRPDYSIRARALRHEPDMFYVNQKMKLVEDQLFS